MITYNVIIQLLKHSTTRIVVSLLYYSISIVIILKSIVKPNQDEDPFGFVAGKVSYELFGLSVD